MKTRGTYVTSESLYVAEKFDRYCPLPSRISHGHVRLETSARQAGSIVPFCSNISTTIPTIGKLSPIPHRVILCSGASLRISSQKLRKTTQTGDVLSKIGQRNGSSSTTTWAHNDEKRLA